MQLHLPTSGQYLWLLPQLQYQHDKQKALGLSPQTVPLLPQSLCVTHQDHSLAFSLLFVLAVSNLYLGFLNSTEFLSAFSPPLLFFFPSLSSSVPDYSNLLSSSGKNNLTALARGRCHPRLDVTAPSLLQLPASSLDFHTSHQRVQQMCVQMLLEKIGSRFVCLAFFQCSIINCLPSHPSSTCCCSLLLVRAAAFTACLPHLSRTSSLFAFRLRIVIQ